MVAFYNAKDQAIYNAGDKFVPQTKYLQSDYIPTEGISYEGDGSPVSYANSGIMTQAPIIYPPINQGGGGGDGPVDPGPPGSYDSAFDPNNENEVEAFNEDIGVGTVAEEDDEETTGLSVMDMVRAGGAYMVGGPFNAINSLNKTNNRNKQKEIDAINAAIEAQYGPSDPGLRGNDGTPGFGITAAGNYTNQFDGGDPGQGQGSNDHDGGASADAQSDDAAGAGGYAKGGRAGYFFGGRVNYKKGGRINFRGGGMDASSDDFGGGTPGPGDTGGEGGTNPSDGSDTQFGGNNNNNNGGNNNPPTINKTSIIDKIRYNPIINNPLTRLVGRVGMYSVNPSLMGLDYRTASQLKGVYDKATEDLDDEDVTMNKFANGGLAGLL